MVEGGADQGAGSPSPPPMPATPAPAATPDPSTTGAIGGGGSSRGIGDMLGDAFSGRGIMGARPGDDVVDPNTGVSAGQQRQISMQSMMGMGLTLLAAGMRQTDDSRAAILAKAPGMIGNSSDSLSNFAKMRLEMANARLKERQLQNADETQKRWGALFGGSGAAAGAPGLGAAPATTPLPGAEAVTGGVAAGQAPTAAPAASSTAPTLQAPAGGAVTPGAPGAATPQQEHPLLAGISPGVRMLLAGMGPEKGMEKLLDIRRGLDEQEVMGQPAQDPNTGKWFAPKIKNGKQTGVVDFGQSIETSGPAAVDPETGRKNMPIMRDGRTVRTENLGDVLKPVTEEDGRIVTRQAGQVVGIQGAPEDPQDREERTASVGLRKKRFETLETSRPDITNLSNQYDRVAQAEKNVREGKTLAGFGADQKAQAMNLMSGLGILSDEGKEALAKSGDANAFLAQAGGEFAKQYYGPQISNSDVENARKAVGAVMSNDPVSVANALARIRKGYQTKIEAYDRDVESHNSRLSGIRSEALRADLQAQKIGRRFDDDAPAADKPADKPASAPIKWGRDPKTGLPVRM
jgi:hypothetical protein